MLMQRGSCGVVLRLTGSVLTGSLLTGFLLLGACGSPPATQTPQASVPPPAAATTSAPVAGAAAAGTPAPGASPASAEAAEPAMTREALDRLHLGGRLFDKWYGDHTYNGDFKPISKDGPGSGGPQGDGTLSANHGNPLENSGHDYRLKNLFGWDLQGPDGIYGLRYHNKSFAKHNLLADPRSEAELVRWFKHGDANLPAFGTVLNDQQLGAIAAFIVAVRDRKLPQPGDVFELSEAAPKNYVLKSGGDAARGARFVDAECSSCHGSDGTELPIDGVYSLGAYSRSKAYEAWLKVLNGHPGSDMGPQLPSDLNVEQQVQLLRDSFAALCDRARYPATAGGKDVADGDLRCGSYLR